MLVDCGSDESAHLLEESLREPAEEDDQPVVTGQGKERERKQKAFICVITQQRLARVRPLRHRAGRK